MYLALIKKGIWIFFSPWLRVSRYLGDPVLYILIVIAITAQIMGQIPIFQLYESFGDFFY